MATDTSPGIPVTGIRRGLARGVASVPGAGERIEHDSDYPAKLERQRLQEEMFNYIGSLARRVAEQLTQDDKQPTAELIVNEDTGPRKVPRAGLLGKIGLKHTDTTPQRTTMPVWILERRPYDNEGQCITPHGLIGSYAPTVPTSYERGVALDASGNLWTFSTPRREETLDYVRSYTVFKGGSYVGPKDALLYREDHARPEDLFPLALINAGLPVQHQPPLAKLRQRLASL